MSDFVVVDASVAVKWLVREAHSVEALALATSWAAAGITVVAPYLMPAEVSNALHKRVLSEELSVVAASHQIELLLASGVELLRRLYWQWPDTSRRRTSRCWVGSAVPRRRLR